MHTLLLGRSVAVPQSRLADIARTLSRSGRPVLVLTERPLAGAEGAEVRALGATRSAALWALTLFWNAVGVLQTRRADVLGATDAVSAGVAVLLSKLVGGTVVFDVSCSATAEGRLRPESLRWRLSLALERWLFRHVDVVLTPTRALRNDLVVRGLVPASRVQVVKAGVDTQVIRSVGRARARNALVLEQGGLFIAAPATTDGAALNALLTALASLRAQADVKLVLIGSPPKRLREAAHARGVGDAVVITGPVERSGLAAWLSACDLAVAPASSELEADPFLLAAMACGLATLASDTAPHREFVSDPALLTPMHATELAIRLSVLVTRSQRRELYGERARLAVQVEGAWESRANEVLRTLGGGGSVIGRPAPALSPSR